MKIDMVRRKKGKIEARNTFAHPIEEAEMGMATSCMAVASG
jgi:hypothetical protein